jgi:hypothetical protein
VSLPESRVSKPAQSLSMPEQSQSIPELALSHHSVGPILAPYAPRLQFPSRVCQDARSVSLTRVPERANLGSSMGLPHKIYVQRAKYSCREMYYEIDFLYILIASETLFFIVITVQILRGIFPTFSSETTFHSKRGHSPALAAKFLWASKSN